MALRRVSRGGERWGRLKRAVGKDGWLRAVGTGMTELRACEEDPCFLGI